MFHSVFKYEYYRRNRGRFESVTSVVDFQILFGRCFIAQRHRPIGVGNSGARSAFPFAAISLDQIRHGRAIWSGGSGTVCLPAAASFLAAFVHPIVRHWNFSDRRDIACGNRGHKKSRRQPVANVEQDASCFG